MRAARTMLPDVEWGGIMEGASALVILTEWNAFRMLDMGHVKSLLTRPLIIDLRNIYTLEEMERVAVTYHSVGRLVVGASQT